MVLCVGSRAKLLSDRKQLTALGHSLVKSTEWCCVAVWEIAENP